MLCKKVTFKIYMKHSIVAMIPFLKYYGASKKAFEIKLWNSTFHILNFTMECCIVVMKLPMKFLQLTVFLLKSTHRILECDDGNNGIFMPIYKIPYINIQ